MNIQNSTDTHDATVWLCSSAFAPEVKPRERKSTRAFPRNKRFVSRGRSGTQIGGSGTHNKSCCFLHSGRWRPVGALFRSEPAHGSRVHGLHRSLPPRLSQAEDDSSKRRQHVEADDRREKTATPRLIKRKILMHIDRGAFECSSSSC